MLRIFGDWGNSSGRLFLMDGETVTDRASVPGALSCVDPAAAFDTVAKGWGVDRALITGAITSNIGWVERGYASTPDSVAGLVEKARTETIDDRRIIFLPGMSCAANRYGAFDTMRGEDVQVIGALGLGAKDGAFGLPGTHTKWVTTENGRITSIHSALTGELFHLLATHSILKTGAPQEYDPLAFRKGIEHALDGAPLTHALPRVRSEVLGGRLTPEHVESYLSGLLVSDDLRGAPNGPLTLIGKGPAMESMQTALTIQGRQYLSLDGENCVIAGLLSVEKALHRL